MRQTNVRLFAIDVNTVEWMLGRFATKDSALIAIGSYIERGMIVTDGYEVWGTDKKIPTELMDEINQVLRVLDAHQESDIFKVATHVTKSISRLMMTESDGIDRDEPLCCDHKCKLDIQNSGKVYHCKRYVPVDKLEDETRYLVKMEHADKAIKKHIYSKH